MVGHIQPRLGDQRAQAIQCPARLRDERMRCRVRVPVDLGLSVAAAPDQVRLHPDDRVAPACRAALDAFQQERVGLAVCQLEEGGHRRFQVRHAATPHQRAASVVIGRAESGETGWDGDIHVLCLCLGDYGPLMLSRFC